MPEPGGFVCLINSLKTSGHQVLESGSYSDGLANVVSDASICLVMVNWTLGKSGTGSHHHAAGKSFDDDDDDDDDDCGGGSVCCI